MNYLLFADVADFDDQADTKNFKVANFEPDSDFESDK